MLYDMTWRIPREQVRLLEERAHKSVSLSMGLSPSFVLGLFSEFSIFSSERALSQENLTKYMQILKELCNIGRYLPIYHL